MAKAPAYQEYAADYLADETIHLMSLEEEGALARLKQICWVSESIPSDLDKLSRLCKGAPTVVLKTVVMLFFASRSNSGTAISSSFRSHIIIPRVPCASSFTLPRLGPMAHLRARPRDRQP